MTRTSTSSRASAGLPTRIVLSALVGLLSLLAIVGLPGGTVALGTVPGHEAAFEQRAATTPAASVRIDRAALDLDESESHVRFAANLPAPVPVTSCAACRPSSDRAPGAADHPLPERPPRA